MSAPIIWIVGPFAWMLVLFLLRRHRMLVVMLSVGGCLVFSVSSWIFPIDKLISLGPLSFEISSVWYLMGRKFVLSPADSSMIGMIYLSAALWLVGAGILKLRRYFHPLVMGFVALLVAALTVEPFLYAALLIEMAVLLSIPMMVERGKSVNQGVLRFLIYQTLAMPFILFAGWVSAGVEANPADQRLLLQAIILLGFGIAFWLAVFPFYSWVPHLSGEVHPYIVGFVLNFLSIVVLLLLLDFIDTYAWLRGFELPRQILRITGVIMVVTAGVWALFEQHFGRLLGYALILENGFSLLALSLGNHTGYEILVLSFFSRTISIGLWVVALSVYKNQKLDLSYHGGAGVLSQYPLVSASFILAIFSLGGLPGLATFPLRLALFQSLSIQSSIVVLWLIIGSLCFLLSGFRTLVVLVGKEHQDWKVGEKIPEAVILFLGMLVLVIAGMIPGKIMEPLLSILRAFTHL